MDHSTTRPTPGFVGSDSFSYQADDGTTGGNTVTVTLTVNAVSVGPNLSHGEVASVGDSWQTVTLPTLVHVDGRDRDAEIQQRIGSGCGADSQRGRQQFPSSRRQCRVDCLQWRRSLRRC